MAAVAGAVCMVLVVAPPVARGEAYGLLENVPAYDWYHGCGPTAVASVLGYWDLQGYDDLFDAAGPDVYATANVKDHISSPAHNAKYDPTPDRTDLPAPPKDCIASWFGTSVDPLQYGWSYLSKTDDAFEGYGAYRGYEIDSWYRRYASGFGWADLVTEVDAGRPMVFLVDSDGNGGTDHFVPVFGYDDRGQEGLYYAMYTTWSEGETVVWQRFRPMSSSYGWGVGYGVYAVPEPIPEPALAAVAMAGMAMLARRRRVRRR